MILAESHTRGKIVTNDTNGLWVIQIAIFNVASQIMKIRGTTKMEKVK